MSQKRIVILGGGFGGLFTALDLGGEGEVTLVTDEDHFTFTPMLYEYLSGEVEEWHIAPRYGELLDEDVRVIQGKVTRVEISAQLVTIENNDPLPYDVLVLAVGGTNNYAGVPGAEQYSIPFRK